jgi:nicotinamidase-related amidase
MWRTRQHASRTDASVFVPGTDGAQIIPAVAPIAGEPVVVKHAPNAFRDTGLKQLLDDQHVEQLVVIGAMSHMCVEATTRAAADFGYPVTVVHDACATMALTFNGVAIPAPQVHATAMAALAFGYAAATDTDAYTA